ncbi:MAG: DUF2059 domain-containing protein [Pseudomonadota bacterium]
MRASATFGAGAIVCLTATFSWADARISVLVDVLKLREVTELLAEEGVAQSQSLNEEMMEGRGGASWAAQVSRIYAPDRMAEHVRAALADALSGDLLEEVIAFYASPLGVEIINLETAARRAIQDSAVEDAARNRFRELAETDDPRLDLVTALIDSGDMINFNLSSAINADYQFLRGLADGKAIEMTEAEMLADVAQDADAITTDTTEWLSGYMLLAYHPLSDDELFSYVTFSETKAGQRLNTALFSGFGAAYEDISYALGRVVALNITADAL